MIVSPSLSLENPLLGLGLLGCSNDESEEKRESPFELTNEREEGKEGRGREGKGREGRDVSSPPYLDLDLVRPTTPAQS